MERYFILDNFNTWYDWRLILTSKTIAPPEPKTKYVEIDGMSGSLDLSESLTGEITYKDRPITATFWTDNGTRKEREKLLRDIRIALHGRKIKIIEPDDPEHYFYGRLKIKSEINKLAYAEFSIECICDPWRYSLNDTVREVVVTERVTSVIINNSGAKTLYPVISVKGNVTITYNDISTTLTDGDYKISNIKLRHGFNIIQVSGTGSVTFTYKEADL